MEQQWQAILIPLIPVIIEALKQIVKNLPRRYLPWMAVLFGMLSDVLLAWQRGDLGSVSPGTGTAIGLASIGLREVYDQTKKLWQERKQPKELPSGGE